MRSGEAARGPRSEVRESLPTSVRSDQVPAETTPARRTCVPMDCGYLTAGRDKRKMNGSQDALPRHQLVLRIGFFGPAFSEPVPDAICLHNGPSTRLAHFTRAADTPLPTSRRPSSGREPGKASLDPKTVNRRTRLAAKFDAITDPVLSSLKNTRISARSKSSMRRNTESVCGAQSYAPPQTGPLQIQPQSRRDRHRSRRNCSISVWSRPG